MAMQPRGVLCDRARAWAALAPDSELSELERRLLGAHIDRCHACAQFALEVAAVAAALRGAALLPLPRPISVPAWRRRPVYARVQAVVAAAAVAAMAFGVASRPPLAPSQRDSAELPRVTNFSNDAPAHEVELIIRRAENDRASATRFRPRRPGIVIRVV
jgi:hypothetical protein